MTAGFASGTAALAEALSARLGVTFQAQGLDPAFGMVKPSDRPDLADFQCNGALAAAKAAKRNPREIAAALADALGGEPMLDAVEVAGPGFINITLAASALATRATDILSDPRAGASRVQVPRNVVIDFGGPNVAKPMHVGHLRSAVIGDTLQRLFRFMGDHVTSDTHLGDWGLQMGQLITELAIERPDLPYFDADFSGPYPDVSPVSIDDLARLYPAASAACKADPERLAAAQAATADLQAGRPGYRALLAHFIAVSVLALKADYARLNVHFDLWLGESDADPFIPALVADLKARGIARLDEGAWIVDVAREDDKKEMPPFMLVNSKGASGYHATDLATLVDRVASLQPALVLYVVDQRQALHFEQVFRAADRAGLIGLDGLEHIGFGTVNGPDGKPFKTREGGTLRLSDLNDMALGEATKRLAETRLSDDLSDQDRSAIADRVALAAIRFADLQNVRTTNYIFDLERFTSFEGKTGPYLLYQAVRIKSLVRRAAGEGVEAGPISVLAPAERGLVLALDGFAAALEGAYERRMPHLLCEHAFSLAQAFSAFYGACPILNETDTALRGSRLSLSQACLKQLILTLDLLGISVPEKM
jgi:arginyl-tRNA synthetase